MTPFTRRSTFSHIYKSRYFARGISSLLLLLLSSFVLSSEVFFSPEGGIQDQIIKHINLSQSSIDVAVYSFTSGDIAEALGNAAKRGVKIRVIRDASQSSEKNDENSYLRQAGIPVEIRAGRGRGIMHDKFAVFDNALVFTGSYNWTNNAEHQNWENALFTDDPKVIQAYNAQFAVLWAAPPRTIKKKTYKHKLPRVSY